MLVDDIDGLTDLKKENTKRTLLFLHDPLLVLLLELLSSISNISMYIDFKLTFMFSRPVCIILLNEWLQTPGVDELWFLEIVINILKKKS